MQPKDLWGQIQSSYLNRVLASVWVAWLVTIFAIIAASFSEN